MIKPLARCTAVVFGASLAAACAVGPDYHRPPFDTAANYKEAGDWKPSEPNDVLSRGPWWKIFKDDTLDGLEDQIDISNQNVKAAEAAFEQSRALVAQARAGFWPTIAGSLGAQREGQPLELTNAAGVPIGTTTRTQNAVTAGVSANWDIDIWGKIRRNTESNVASAQANSAALAAARLSAQADLATDYFELRAQDQLEKLLDDTVVAETLSLKITESRYKFGARLSNTPWPC
jgi:outer membrane protein TolC